MPSIPNCAPSAGDHQIDAASVLAEARGTVYSTPADTVTGLLTLLQHLRAQPTQADRAKRELATTLELLSIGRRLLGDYVAGLRESAESKALFAELGDEAGVAKACILAGNLHFCMGGYDSALKAFEAGLELRRKLGDRKGEAGALGSIGAVLDEVGRLEEARNCYVESLVISRELGDRMFEARTLNNLGETQLKMGELDAAEENCTAALRLFREMDDRVEQVHTLNNCGSIARAHGRYGEARSLFEQAARAGAEIGDRGSVVGTKLLLGRLLAAPDTGFQAADDSRRLLEQALEESRKLDAPQLEADICRELAVVLEQSGDTAPALALLRESYALERALHTEAMEKRLRHLQVEFGLDRARREAEAERKKAGELARLNRNLETQKRQLDDTVRRLLKLDREKSDLLGMAAHDIKNPLASIIALAEEQLEQPEDAAKSAREIRDQAQGAFDLVSRILEVNAFDEGRRSLLPVPVDVVLVLNTVACDHASRATAKSIAFVCEPGVDPLDTFTDPVLLRQVFDNLISNAIKYTPGGGRVEVRARRDGRWIIVSIKDTGPGFSAEDRKHLFERFTRLSARPTAGEDSTGLGLYIAKCLVTDLEGELVCESEPDRGATFIVRLPVLSSA